MKKLRAYLKSKKYKASGQPSSGGDANADLNQPILGNSNSGTAPKGGQPALKVSAKKPNAGKSGAGSFKPGTLDDEAVADGAKGLKGGPVKQDGNQKGFNMKGPNPLKASKRTTD